MQGHYLYNATVDLRFVNSFSIICFMQIIVSRLNDILLAQVGGKYTSFSRGEDEAQSLRILKENLKRKSFFRTLRAEKIG